MARQGNRHLEAVADASGDLRGAGHLVVQLVEARLQTLEPRLQPRHLLLWSRRYATHSSTLVLGLLDQKSSSSWSVS